MANNSPTIVAASLSDDQLKKSIESLVTHVDEAMKKMVQSTNNAVGEMEAKLKSLGNLKIDSGGSADGGASKRTKAQNAETDAVEKSIVARDKQIKKNQDVATSFDQMAKAQQVAIRSASPSGIRNADTLQTMNIQLDLLRERLREARQQYSSFVALAAHATTTGDKGLFQYATDGVHRYEQEIRNLIPQIRTLQSGIQQMGDVIAPQGHTIQNYVNSLQKANPELAALNAQYKSGTSLLQTQSTSYTSARQSAQHYTEEVRKQAQAQQQSTQAAKEYSEQVKRIAAEIRESAQWQKSDKLGFKQGMMNLDGRAYPVTENLEMGLRLEDQIVSVLQRANEERQKGVQITQQQAQASHGLSEEDRKAAEQLGWIEEKRAKRRYISPSMEEISQIRAALQSITGQQEKWVDDIDKTKASYNQLSQHLKELKTIHADIWRDPKNANAAKVIAQEIQTVQREMQKWQQTMSRPISLKDALGGSEKTLDDIAYKMRRLQSYRSGLDVNAQHNEIRRVNYEYDVLKKKMDEVMQKNSQMISSNTALGRSWNYMKNRLAFYFTVGASTQFVKNLIEIRSQYEMNERALGILINSAERGTQIFNELSQMALVSPYTLIELSSAAKQLTAYDIAAKDVVNTTRRLADMAAAVGIPIERLTYALGQVKAYGYLNARDARMFANAGIPLVKNLSEYYTELEGRLVSTADIYDRIKKKQIGYEEVMSTISKMTDEGGKFFDFQAKMAETLKVQLANLTLAWNNMLNDMGEESQGVLVGGIGALKQMFLHWKDIEHILTEVVVALGAYKAYQLITTRLMGATSASLDAQIIAMKRNNAAMLEKQALTRKLTVDELRQVAAQNQVTAADYRNALSGKNLTKQKALLLVALNKNNVQLKAAIVNMGLLTAQEAANVTTGRALAIVFKSIGISIRNAAMAMKAFMVSNWWMLALGGIYELYHAWDSYNEHVAEINRSAAEHAKEAFESIKTYLEGDVINTLRETLRQGGKVSSDAEGQKAWDEMREKIELSSSASNVFIARLMKIDDINQRLSAGFDYLNNIQRVAGVMQTLGDDAIKVSTTKLGGLLGEGLKDDLNDFVDAYQKYVNLNENLRQSGVGEEYFNEQKRALEEFRSEVEKTTISLYNIASRERFNINEQREFFERGISETAQAEQMGIKETRIYRMQAEDEYYDYARKKLVERYDYENKIGAWTDRDATEREIKALDEEFGSRKAMQESFFTWLTEKQDHAVKNMLRGKTQEEIKQGDWLKGANGKWVEEMARKFSKEYGVSFDDLHRLVMNANTWSINIPVFFQTIGQSLTDVQRDYEARTGKKFSSNYLIKDAKSQVEILDILKKKQKEVAQEMETARKAGGQYWEKNKLSYKEENDALIADIHAYNALTDAEEKANKKGNRGSKKDPLLDALKQEISLVEKLQGDYDKLTKSGASQADAIETIRGAYGKTIRLLNAQLQSYGLPQIDISQLITGKDPNKALAHFKKTLDTLESKGILTLERSKELEAVVEKFTISAKTYNLDMITKGLNNELDRLKEEYELAVELDANPELGDMFADYFGINLKELPKDYEQALKLAQKRINTMLKNSPDVGIASIDIEKLMSRNKFDAWVSSLGKDASSELIKGIGNVRSFLYKVRSDETKKQIQEWDKLLEKYAEYEHKVAQIQKEAEREREIAREKGASQDILDAINNREKQNLAQLSFEEFQKSPEWIVATGELANMSRSALGMLIDKIQEYRKTAKNLSPKQIKQINQALRQLYKEQRQGNPFGYISNMLDRAKDKMDVFNEEIADVEEQIRSAEDAVNAAYEAGEDASKPLKKLSELKKAWKQLKEEQKKPGEIDANAWVGALNETIGAVNATIGVFDDLAKAIGGVNGSDVDKVFSVLESAGSAAAIGAQIGGAWGAVIGSVVGAATSLVSIFAGSSNKKITSQIEESKRAVKRLELAYIDLEHAVQQAYGMATIGANMAAKANKELQLVELKRQLALERSRDSKDRDEDKIIDLQKQIKELEYDIADTVDNIVNDLLGISSVGDALENVMGNIIDAFRSGSYKIKDIMKDVKVSFNDMIANMVMKMYTTRVLQPWFEEQWNKIQSQLTERAGDIPDKLAEIQSKTSIAKNADTSNNDSLIEALRALGMNEGQIQSLIWFDIFGQHDPGIDINARLRAAYEKLLKEAEQKESELQKELATATMPTTDDIRQYAELLRSGQPIVTDQLKEIESFLRELGLLNDKKKTTLSDLQAGISGITEDTAGALEAITNGISQQSYLQSDLLTQIRDAVVGMDMDVQVATQAQMLLQLQQSYAVQMAIQGILEGWNNPSGQAVRVELVS